MENFSLLTAVFAVLGTIGLISEYSEACFLLLILVLIVAALLTAPPLGIGLLLFLIFLKI